MPKRDNRTLYIGLAIGGGVVVLCVMVACGVGIMWMAGKGANGGPTPTRDELQTRLIGKTPGEVKAILGTPSDTRGTGDDQTWYYSNVARDPVTGKIDPTTFVRFESGRVVRTY